MRFALSLLLIAHGVAHVVGFVVPWKLISMPEMPYRTTVFRGGVDLGHAGIRLVGLLWLGLAVGFAAWGVSIVLNRPWHTAALALVGASLVLCAAQWPETRLGVAVNLFLLATLYVFRVR
jgi:hypothetical protein